MQVSGSPASNKAACSWLHLLVLVEDAPCVLILQAMLGNLSAQLLWTRYRSNHISPHSPIATGSFGLFPGLVATFSIFLTTRRPSPRTRPNTTCLLSSQSVFAQVMKNWQPFEPGPLLACRQSNTCLLACVQHDFDMTERSVQLRSQAEESSVCLAECNKKVLDVKGCKNATSQNGR